MASLDDNDVNYAVYRSNDSIKNFKIRVTLERLTSNALIPSLPRLKILGDLSRLLDKDGPTVEKPMVRRVEMAQASDEGNRSEYEETVINWQQKLFSRFEFARYERDMGPHKTPLERIYLDEIQKMKASGKQPGRIFTYIEGDPYCFERDLEYFMTDSPNEQPSELALGMNTIHRRRPTQSRFKLSEQHLLNNGLIKEKLTSDDLRVNHFGSLPCQTMYIMADLSDTTDRATAHLAIFPQPPNEHVLCRIHMYSSDTIVLKPDFNIDTMAYMIETGNLNNDVYQYYLEHASTPISTHDLIRERRLFNEICFKQQTYLAQVVGNEFDIPPPAVLKLNVFGEIVSGKNFEYDNVYIYYSLDLTDNWHVESSAILSGYTQTASTTMSSKYDDIVYYSHPFEFELWYKPPPNSADHEFPRMPQIYFQVASLDSWGRHRTEGYTYIDIPSLPGFYDEHLPCWRPRGDSIFDELRRFFIGGSVELEDLTYVAIPKSFESEKDIKPLSRFGFRTITTGSLNVRFNVVFQSQSFAMERRKKHRTHAVNRYGFDAFMSNINTVLDEFERARRRALQVRESVYQTLAIDTSTF